MFVMFDEVMMCATLRLSMVKIGMDKTAIRECFDTTGVQVHIRVYDHPGARSAKAYHRGLMVR
jgi:hypothetical protein